MKAAIVEFRAGQEVCSRYVVIADRTEQIHEWMDAYAKSAAWHASYATIFAFTSDRCDGLIDLRRGQPTAHPPRAV